MVAQHKKLFPNMTKYIKLNPLDLGCKRKKELIFYSNNVTIKIEDVIKKFKFEKFHILMRTQKRRRQFNYYSAAAINNGFSEEATALWCYSMIICIKGTFVIKEKTPPRYCFAPQNSPGV